MGCDHCAPGRGAYWRRCFLKDAGGTPAFPVFGAAGSQKAKIKAGRLPLSGPPLIFYFVAACYPVLPQENTGIYTTFHAKFRNCFRRPGKLIHNKFRGGPASQMGRGKCLPGSGLSQCLGEGCFNLFVGLEADGDANEGGVNAEAEQFFATGGGADQIVVREVNERAE